MSTEAASTSAPWPMKARVVPPALACGIIAVTVSPTDAPAPSALAVAFTNDNASTFTTPLTRIVRLAKLRWRVERDYQEMKAELGLDHFEGRTWRGFHHHATLVSVAHAFLALRRALSPPERNTVDAAHGA